MSVFAKPEKGFFVLPVEKQIELLENLMEEFESLGLNYQANILYRAINEK